MRLIPPGIFHCNEEVEVAVYEWLQIEESDL